MHTFMCGNNQLVENMENFRQAAAASAASAVAEHTIFGIPSIGRRCREFWFVKPSLLSGRQTIATIFWPSKYIFLEYRFYK